MGARNLTNGYTTLYIEQCGDWWLATQDGVDTVGTGESATRAVVDYCYSIEEANDGDQQ
jgi:hypothetical protein